MALVSHFRTGLSGRERGPGGQHHRRHHWLLLHVHASWALLRGRQQGELIQMYILVYLSLCFGLARQLQPAIAGGGGGGAAAEAAVSSAVLNWTRPLGLGLGLALKPVEAGGAV